MTNYLRIVFFVVILIFPKVLFSDNEINMSNEYLKLYLKGEFNQIQKEFLEYAFLEIKESQDLKTFFKLIEDSKFYAKIDTTKLLAEKIVQISPAFLIKNIKIDHNTDLDNSELMQILTIKSGSYITAAIMKKELNDLDFYLKSMGYLINDISYQKEGSVEGGTLLIEINNTKKYLIKELQLIGVKKVFKFLLELETHIFHYHFLESVYSDKMAAKNLFDIKKYYNESNFYDAKVKADVTIDSLNLTANVTYKIDEGREYSIVFEGSDFFFDFEFEKELKPLSRNGLLALDKIKKDIAEKYKRYGYKDVSCQYQLVKEEQDAKILFKINEGLQYLIDSVYFHGVSEKYLEQVKANTLSIPGFFDDYYDEQRVKSDEKALRNYYKSIGFFDAKVSSKVKFKKEKVILDFYIEEKKQYLTGEVNFIPKGCLADSVISKLDLKKDSIFTTRKFLHDKQYLVDYLHKKGYVEAQVKSKKSREGLIHNISWIISAEKSYKISKIFLNGNFKTSGNYIKRFFSFRKNYYYSLKDISQSRRDLVRTSLFNDVYFQDFIDTLPRTPIIVKVSEKKPYTVELGVGYDNIHEFNGLLNFTNINLLGYGKEFNSSFYLSQPVVDVELSLIGKYSYFYNFNYKVTTFYNYRDNLNRRFLLKQYGGEFLTNIRFGILTPGLSIGFKNRLADYSYEAAYDNKYRAITVISPSIVMDTRDDLITPTSGGYYAFTANYSFGHRTKDDTYSSYISEIRYLFPFFRKNLILATRIKNAIIPTNREIHEDHLFFIGGLTSIRGYHENKLYTSEIDNKAIGYLQYTMSSLELRWRILSKMEFDLFMDNAYIHKFKMEASNNRLKSSLGLGLRYLSPIGPIGVLYGHKLKRESNEDRGRFYFSIGYTF